MAVQNEEENDGLLGFFGNPLGKIAQATAKGAASVPWGDIGTGIKKLAPDIVSASLPAGMGSGTMAKNTFPEEPETKIINDENDRQLAFKPGHNGSLTVMPPTAPAQKPLPGMPADVDPNEIENYLTGKRGQLAKYGADNQMALQARTDMDRNSLPYMAKDAGKGFADALMMGVAGAGNPNWQGQFENQQNEQANQRMQTMRGANDANLKQIEGGMSLDKMDAKSPLSKSSQQTYAPLFQKLGYQPASINNMSAANIENAIGLMSQYGGEEVKAKIQRAQMDIENKKLDAMLQNTQSEIQNRNQGRAYDEKKLRQQQLEDVAKLPMTSRLFNTDLNKSMEQAAGLSEPAAMSHPRAKEAMAWAQENPNDPRAHDIMQRLNQ